MNEAISALAASNTTDTLKPVDILAWRPAENEVVHIVDAVEQDAKSVVTTEVGSAESEVAKIETEVKKVAVEAEAEMRKIEEAALKTVTNINEKVRNAVVATEQFVEKEAKRVWEIPHGGGSILRNPA